MGAKTFLPLLWLSLLLAACMDDATDKFRPALAGELALLDAGLDKWEASALSAYNLRSGCTGNTGCESRYKILEVIDGRVASGYDYSSSQFGEAMSGADLENTLMIDDVFSLLRETLLSGNGVEVEYDERYGYPKRWRICNASGCSAADGVFNAFALQ